MNSRILEKIKLMLNMTVENGCTEEEAQAAASKVSELLLQYGLEERDITESQLYDEFDFQMGHHPINTEEYTDIPKTYSSLQILVVTCAVITNCKILRMENGTTFVIIGQNVNVETAIKIFEELYHRFLQITGIEAKEALIRRREKLNMPKIKLAPEWKESFFAGMTDRVSIRLKEEFASQIKKHNAEQYSIELRNKAQDYMDDHWKHGSASAQCNNPINANAYQRGQSAGNHVDIPGAAKGVGAGLKQLGGKSQ